MGLGSASGAAIQRGVEKRLIFSQLIDMQLICQGSTRNTDCCETQEAYRGGIFPIKLNS